MDQGQIVQDLASFILQTDGQKTGEYTQMVYNTVFL